MPYRPKDPTDPDSLRPQKRSSLRSLLGRWFYTGRRHIAWWTDGRRYARRRSQDLLPVILAEHRTPLLRKLGESDMQLQYNKIANLRLAVERLNSLVLEPGEYFSYWRLIGRPTHRKGYQDGMVLHYGTVQSGVGGGLCQLSNMIYWITLHTPLTVAERHRHSYDVFPDSKRDQPFGSGATCVYNYRDLGIVNSLSRPVQLRLWLSESHLHGQWLSAEPGVYRYRIIERDHMFRREFWGGYTRHNTIHREVYAMDGQRVDTEYVTENHALMMYEPLLEAPAVAVAQDH